MIRVDGWRESVCGEVVYVRTDPGNLHLFYSAFGEALH